MLFDSFIEIQNQILGAAVSIAGAPFSLHYSSDRVRGRAAAYTLKIPLSAKSVPEGFKGIKLEVLVAGQRFTKDFPPAQEQSYTFTWDGKDGSGRPVQGKQEAKIRVGYVYKAFYPRPEITRWQESTKAVGAWDASALGLNGWSLSVHHAYDRLRGVLYLGDGRRRSNLDVTRALTRGDDAGRRDGDEIIIPAEDASQLYIFNSEGRHLRTIHALTGGLLYRIKYDASGYLSAIEDGDGNITRIERTAEGSPTEIVAPYGQRHNLAANGQRYLAGIHNGAGERVRFGYSEDGLLQSLTDPKGNVYRFSYDELGRLISEEDPAGAVTELASRRDDSGSLVAVISPLGHESTYLIERLPTGEERRVNKCCGSGAIVELRAAEGHSTVTYPNGMITTLEQQPNARFGTHAPLPKSETITSPGGRTSITTIRRIVELADSHDPFSVKTVTDILTINGRSYRSVFRADSATWIATTPTGRHLTTTIDRLGRIIRLQRAAGLPIKLDYNERGGLGRITQENGAEERAVTFSYDTLGYLEKITDPLGRTSEFSYDTSGRLVTETRPDGRTLQFAYDANANVSSVTPPGRPGHAFAYTAANLPSAYKPPGVPDGSNDTRYAYNSDGQLELMTHPDGRAVKLNYDDAGRLLMLDCSRGQIVYGYDTKLGALTSITSAAGVTLSYGYDGSLLTDTTWAGTVNGRVSRAYDNDFRVISLSINDTRTVLQYDDDNLLTRAGDLALTRDVHNGLIRATAVGKITDTRGYNAFDEVTRYEASFSGTTIYAVEYIRDKLGRIVERTETIGGLTATCGYGYDRAGRVAEVKKNGGTVATYTYDSNGNRMSGPRLSMAPTYDAQDRLLQYGSTVYAYTRSGELQSKTAEAGTMTYEYDELGNLRAVTLFDGGEIEYVIDGTNRRIGKKINGSLVQGWLYQDLLKPIAELDGNCNIICLFVYASRYNVPDYMVKAGAIYRIISDHLGSPRLVVDVANGTIAQRIDYDEFGNILQDSSPGFQPFGFAGGLYDRDTKLVRFGARDYDAETGRWTAKDPVLFDTDQPNLYAYVGDDPINAADPLGLDPADWNQLLSLSGQEGVVGRQAMAKIGEELMHHIEVRQLVADLNRYGRRVNTAAGRALFETLANRAPQCNRGLSLIVGPGLGRLGLTLGEVGGGIAPTLAIAPILPPAEQAAERVGQDFAQTPLGQGINSAVYNTITGVARYSLRAPNR